MAWTQFWDMHSGGRAKEYNVSGKEIHHIYIEAPEEEAKIIFYNRFGHNPERVTCTCCGDDYSISESETLEQASAFQRDCAWDNNLRSWAERGDPEKTWEHYRTLEEYSLADNVLIIPAEEIKEEERVGDLPVQGYVWM